MKLKRSLSIFLTLLFTLVTVAGVAPAAHARACNHTYVTLSDIKEYRNPTASGHECRITTRERCTKCGHLVEDIGDWYSEGHSERIYDLGHNTAQGTHTYERRCSKCYLQIRTQTFPCPGPPCPVPQSLRPIYELQ